MADQSSKTTDDSTISQYILSEAGKRSTQEINTALRQIPLTLQPFFREHTDLNGELVRRFPNMPLMSVIRFRDLYADGERGVATLTSQDGAASLIVDVSRRTSEVQFSFMYGSMLSLRFNLDDLSALDRRAWLDNLETREEEIVFLWSESRWTKDYAICVPHKYYISLLAFSPNNFEAAVRITPAVSDDLFGWMRGFWFPDDVASTDDEATTDADENSDTILGSW